MFRPQYKDKKTGTLKKAKIWWYEFIFAGRPIRESAKTPSKTVAKEAEKRRRRELEEGFNGLGARRNDRIRPICELAESFLADYKLRQPRSATFAEHALRHIEQYLGDLMAVDMSYQIVMKYQTDRLSEGASPKTINDEVGFLLRLLNVSQAGAIRAQLKQQKRLKLKVDKRIGKAYSPEEKQAITGAAKQAPRSKSIHFVTMLAQHAGLRDKEIRTLQWNRLNLTTRIITVGQTKTDAGSGRTIPLNDDLFTAAIEYSKWYTSRFGSSQSDWYVFPFGKPRPNDPTRPQTSLKTAWRNVRKKAKVEGRFHDNRHTFVTDLAESGAGDQVIQDLAGHISKDMVKHYSHIRTEAKRRAVAALSKSVPTKEEPPPQPHAEISEGVLQELLQVTLVN